MTDKLENVEILELTTEIVASYVSNNTVAAADLPAVISDIYRSLAGLSSQAALTERPKPAVMIKNR